MASQLDYDVIIIGAGAGGGVAAGVLAEAGKSVLILDRGAAHERRDVTLDHLRNHRLAQYGYNTETARDLEGRPRVFVDSSGKRHVLNDPLSPGYGYNASLVGGGTVVYGAQAWRFLPKDFRMASTYGVPEGSSLADWPISYDDLAPYYDKVEWEMGISGDGSRHKLAGWRERDFPMPPIHESTGGHILRKAAEQLGWDTGPVPLLINSTNYNGRPACMKCGMCVGFSCPNDSKTGSQNTMLPRAFKTGRCTLVPHATAERLVTDHRGKVTGVAYVIDDASGITRKTVHAKAVVIACGASETARLLLNSQTDQEPNGIGNNSDQVGRHVQAHYYQGAHGLYDDIVQDGVGPGVTISTLQHAHDNPGIVGGGMIANEFIKLPIIFYKGSFAPGVPRWGLAAKEFMRDYYRRTIHVQGPIQEIPAADGRISIDADVRDKYGLPVARLSGTQHHESIKAGHFLRDKAIEWLQATGAKKTWGWAASTPHLSVGQHQAGTTRMGNDPATSVTDAYCRVHSHDNIFIADGSPHVTNGPLNPVLTILALAWRTAEHAAKTIQ